MEIDRTLVQACIKQNRGAQKQLYLTLLPYLRAVVRRYLRNGAFEKDVLQEGFVKLFRSMDKYDFDKAPLKSWAARIFINTAINYNERVIGKPKEEFVNEKHEMPVVDISFETAITDERLLHILKKMPDGYFEIFNLFVIDGYDHREISEMLNISEVVSRKKLSRAKNWLRNSRELLTLGAMK